MTPRAGPPALSAPTNLSVVIPVHNEPTWIRRTLIHTAKELAASGLEAWEIVVVNDGSTDRTPDVVRELASSLPVRLISQPNTGRLGARRAGIEAVSFDWVLLLDSRVLLDGGGLGWLIRHVSVDACVWNGHCVVNTKGNVYGKFWDALPRVAWARYLSNPRTSSFGVEDFDWYPKGTGCFLAPRSVLLDGYRAFSTYFADTRNASDDTALIKRIAEVHRIWISPDFGCSYEARGSLRAFTPHVIQRGVYFVDGHLRRGGRFAPVIVTFYLVSAAMVLGIVRWPLSPILGLAVIDTLAVSLATTFRLPVGHVAAVAVLSPLFTVAYGFGMWKGLTLLARDRLRAFLRSEA